MNIKRLTSIAIVLTLSGCCALEGPSMSSVPTACLPESRPSAPSDIPYVGMVTRVGCFEATCSNIVLVTDRAYSVNIPKEFSDMPIPMGSQVYLSPWDLCIDNGSELRCQKR